MNQVSEALTNCHNSQSCFLFDGKGILEVSLGGFQFCEIWRALLDGENLPSLKEVYFCLNWL